MADQQLVVLFGDSLLMDTVEANLAGNPAVGLMRIHPTVTDVAERLQALGPDLVIVDLHAPQAGRVLPFLWDRPGVPLLGLDVTCGRAIVLSSQAYTPRSADDLAHLIAVHTGEAQVGQPAAWPFLDGCLDHDLSMSLLDAIGENGAPPHRRREVSISDDLLGQADARDEPPALDSTTERKLDSNGVRRKEP